MHFKVITRTVTLNINGTVNYAYDAVGNLKTKTDYSANSGDAYQYQAGSHRLTHVTLKDNGVLSFTYDNKGNQLSQRTNGSDKSRDITSVYNVFNKPTSITRSGTQISLSYGADLMRYKQEKVKGGKTTTTLYIDKLYEVETGGGQRRERSYISDVAIIRDGDKEGDKGIRYSHRDRLGSAITLTNHSGQVVTRRHFDAFGKPKGGDWRNN